MLEKKPSLEDSDMTGSSYLNRLLQTSWMALAAFLVLACNGAASAIPYEVDAHTLHLYHFDGDGTDSVTVNPIHLVLGGGATVTDDSYEGMGQALNTYEGTAEGGTQPSAMVEDLVSVGDFTGLDGQFTFEAIVCPTFPLAALPNNMQIVSGEGDAERGWQFRIEPGSLVFIGLTGTVQTLSTPIPTTGPHAYAQDKWFHAAVTYNGQPGTDGNLKMYWTALDAGVANAVELASLTLNETLNPAAQVRFGVGNEGRDWNGRTENFEGWIDEVRISDIARNPEQMITRIVGRELASNPNPGDGATDVLRDVVLSWKPGQFADKHNLYLGTDASAVSLATPTSDPAGVYLGQIAPSNYPESGTFRLEFGRTYYWRVDEVNAPPDLTVYPGAIWSFTVEPEAYPLASERITASASSVAGDDMMADKTIDSSGLDANDVHSAVAGDMWLSDEGGPEPAWIRYDFDKTYKLHEMWVWNYNQDSQSALGAKDVTITYVSNGVGWITLGDVELAQAPGATGSAPGEPVDLARIAAQAVQITINSTWGSQAQAGLSEVRFCAIPVAASDPDPVDGTTDTAVDINLSWRAGREAVSHEIYLSTDIQAVADGTALLDVTGETSYALSDLAHGAIYYWQIHEVNDAESVTSWPSDIWSFSTQQFRVLDDFESYNDEDNLIYDTWIDGWVNGTGSTVGNLSKPYAERGTVHSGRQSMPFTYDNFTSPNYSEAERQWAASQDWSSQGFDSLVMWFEGDAENSAEPLYTGIIDSNGGVATVTHPESAAAQLDGWQKWTVDLGSFGDAGVDLTSVTGMLLGVGNKTAPVQGVGGILYFDDMRVYVPAPIVPVDPGTEALVAYYAFENNVNDLSGSGLDGDTLAGARYVTGQTGYGMAVSFDGNDDYVELPIGDLIASLTDTTVSAWTNFSGGSGSWQRIWDFGTGTDAYMFLTPRTGTVGTMRFAIVSDPDTGESVVNATSSLPSGWHHVAVTIDSATMIAGLYLDGELVASGLTSSLPADLGQTTQNWLGRSQYEADDFYEGELDEFRIYDRALSEAEVLYLVEM
jgi:hypothetical protein